MENHLKQTKNSFNNNFYKDSLLQLTVGFFHQQLDSTHSITESQIKNPLKKEMAMGHWFHPRGILKHTFRMTSYIYWRTWLVFQRPKKTSRFLQGLSRWKGFWSFRVLWIRHSPQFPDPTRCSTPSQTCLFWFYLKIGQIPKGSSSKHQFVGVNSLLVSGKVTSPPKKIRTLKWKTKRFMRYLQDGGRLFVDEFFEWFWTHKDAIVLVSVYSINDSRTPFFLMVFAWLPGSTYHRRHPASSLILFGRNWFWDNPFRG